MGASDSTNQASLGPTVTRPGPGLRRSVQSVTLRILYILIMCVRACVRVTARVCIRLEIIIMALLLHIRRVCAVSALQYSKVCI